MSSPKSGGRPVSVKVAQTLPAAIAGELPEAASVVARDAVRTWSRADWNARVNQLTRDLVSRGVGRGAFVPLVSPPTPEALQAMLAVMQAGAAYVPLDPAYGASRIKAVLDEVRSPIVLTSTSASGTVVAPDASGSGGIEVVRIDALDLSAHSGDQVTITAAADDPAYMIYTSGTTGQPNGVVVTHAALMNYLTWCASYYPVRASSGGTVVHTSIGFDLTVTSLFVPLLLGQTITFAPAESGDLTPLAKALQTATERFGFVKMTPSHLRGLRRLLGPTELARAGVLILGGEQLYAEDLAGLEPATSQGLRLFNEYGPTETVVGSTCFEIEQLAASGPMPIGTPIANTSVYVLDERMQALPAGETGELYIGGAGLAVGYFQRDDLTARKFVTLPATGTRVYRTGDLARADEHGVLTLAGRQDQQVKLRGYRIEPQEIASALTRHEAVSESVVLLDGERDEARLIAFVVPEVSRREIQTAAGRIIRYAISPSELHVHLAGQLPAYMVPSLFVLIDAVPLTAHGKLDRAALLRLAAADTGVARAGYVPPRTDLEAVLAAVFGKVLKVETVGIDDNYFALGGDSIRSIQIAGEAQLRGLKLSVGDLHRHPTIAALAERLSQQRSFTDMPETKPFDLIAQDDRDRMPAGVEDAYPLNLLQEGMIYHRAFAAKSAVYHAMLSLRLEAPFDLGALRDSVQALVNRHPLLRTSFDQRSFSQPLQLVHATFKDPLQFVDLTGLPEAEQRSRLAAWHEEEKARGFDVDEYPLIRFMAHRLGDGVFNLTFSYHHEIIDGWSESTMVSELLTQYLSIVSGDPVTITPPKASFRDSVRLEQMALASEEFRTFWERALEGASYMRLPRLLSAPKADKGQRAIVKLHFPFTVDHSHGLKRLAIALGVPLKSVLLAGHMKVMGLFGGGSDVVTHTVSNGRPESPDGIGLIGLFVNSFTFRQRLRHGSWRDLVLDTLRLEQASIPYRRYPMAELKRHQGRDPLSETLFFLIDYHIYHRLDRWKNARLVNYDVYGESTFPFCATFRVDHFTTELDMQIEYDSLQFPRELIDAIVETYRHVFDSMVTNPAALHHLFAPPAPAVVNRLAAARTIHEWFGEQARRTPHAIAVACGGKTLSYAALDARANQLARWLRAKGVGPDVVVALLLERSSDLLAAMLATLKAGGCYLPLDPEHRSERLAAMLDAAAPLIVVTQQALEPLLADTKPSCPVHTIEAAWTEATALETTAPPVAVAPENLAYVIFTSGSTGTPKGVMVSHASLVASTRARLTVYDAAPERFLLLSSQAFDSSVAGIYWTLCTGRTLVIPPGRTSSDLNEVLGLIRREAVTHTLCIPSLYGSVLESARDGDLASLRTVIVAGEECRSELWAQHQRQMPEVSFYNEYGPSEATVWSTVWKGTPAERASLPIGGPLPDVTAHVLDRDQQLVPLGVGGELYVGGAHVCRGYLRQPAATAERFVPDAFSTAPGARLYRTGDLSRLTRAGDLDYLGRIDHQLKVRGFRIEPAEIEATLERHPLVKRAVVVPHEDRTGERVLVAYVVAAADGAPTETELLAYAKDKLPRYLLPASYVLVDAMPLTATGKVDRAALKDAAAVTPERAPRVAPRTPTEEAIAGIWSRVLGIDHVSVHEDFFAAGGESLRAMRVLSQIRKTFDVELPIAVLMQIDATVASLASAVDSALWVRAHPASGTADPTLEDVVV